MIIFDCSISRIKKIKINTGIENNIIIATKASKWFTDFILQPFVLKGSPDTILAWYQRHGSEIPRFRRTPSKIIQKKKGIQSAHTTSVRGVCYPPGLGNSVPLTQTAQP
jgi:hypothetical protein